MFNKKLWKRKTMNNYKKLESGRSMIEMLGVLAIIGVLSVGGIAGYSKAMNKFKTNKVADNFAMIVTNIRTLYAQQNNYSGLTTATAINMGVVPDELINDDKTTLKNAFLGPVFIGSATVKGMDNGTDSGTNRGFVVYMGGLTREACVTLATNDWGSGYSSGHVGVRASGATIENQAALTTAVVDGGENVFDKINCTGVAASGADNAGVGYACVGGSAMKTPYNVADASSACNCTTNTCSVMLKYF